MLRKRLDEALHTVEQGNKAKGYMQENLKKAFMRSVCALNFEAMNILDPNAKDLSQGQLQQNQISLIENEMNRQLNFVSQSEPYEDERMQHSNLVTPISSQIGAPTTQRTYVSQSNINLSTNVNHGMSTATHGQASRMNTTESRFNDTAGRLTYSASAVSDVSQQQPELIDERSQASGRFIDVIPNNPKIESKDHMWKPAPIMGRDFTQREVNEPEVIKPGQS